MTMPRRDIVPKMSWLVRRCLPPEMRLTDREWWKLEYHLTGVSPLKFTRQERRLIAWHCAGMAALLVIGIAVVENAVPKRHAALVGLCGAAAWALAVCWGFTRLTMPALRRKVSTALRLMGHHVCCGCGHWLRVFEDDPVRCPECGRLQPDGDEP